MTADLAALTGTVAEALAERAHIQVEQLVNGLATHWLHLPPHARRLILNIVSNWVTGSDELLHLAEALGEWADTLDGRIARLSHATPGLFAEIEAATRTAAALRAASAAILPLAPLRA